MSQSQSSSEEDELSVYDDSSLSSTLINSTSSISLCSESLNSNYLSKWKGVLLVRSFLFLHICFNLLILNR
jgi:hypothetical protein